MQESSVQVLTRTVEGGFMARAKSARVNVWLAMLLHVPPILLRVRAHNDQTPPSKQLLGQTPVRDL